MLTVGSLFSGIGGFDLGLERTGGFKVVWQVENDPYCQLVLAKHWPNVPRYGDIRSIDWRSVPRVDLLCGGFPCQDLSYAGKRAGIDGERSGLWSEFHRAIVYLRPALVLVENVPGLLSNAYLGRVLGNLAESGYDAEWDCVPASAVGAPHRRDRIWITAYCRANDQGQPTRSIHDEASCVPSNVAVPIGQQSEGRHHGVERRQRSQSIFTETGGARDAVADEWWAVEPDVGRVAHGVPARVDRLKGLGNAVVPQVVEWIGRRLLEVL